MQSSLARCQFPLLRRSAPRTNGTAVSVVGAHAGWSAYETTPALPWFETLERLVPDEACTCREREPRQYCRQYRQYCLVARRVRARLIERDPLKKKTARAECPCRRR